MRTLTTLHERDQQVLSDRHVAVGSRPGRTRLRARGRLSNLFRQAISGPIAGICIPAALALILRLPFIGRPLYPDEAGYLLVGRHWHGGGLFLYGDLFVDRPPLLIGLYRLFDALGGIEPLRLFATFAVVAMTVAAGWGGWMVSGARGARWASFTAAALASSPLLDATEADGELLAVPLVMVSCALMIAATRPADPLSRRRQRYAVLAGLTATSALLVKQNFVDALVFSVVLIASAAATSTLSFVAARRAFAAFVFGAAAPVIVVLGWAAFASTGIHDLWFALYGFRTQAFHVILSHSFAAPDRRLHMLVIATVQTGMCLLAAVYVLAQPLTRRQRQPHTLATLSMLAAATMGIALGASYWKHYLIELIPALALASADLARAPVRSVVWAARATVALTVASAMISVVSAATSPPSRSTSEATGLEDWLGHAAQPADSIFVAYGQADIAEASGLRTVYPYLWSLPMRTLDPSLTQLREIVEGSDPPTWLVVWNDLNSWHIDSTGRLHSAITTKYSFAGTVCGRTVYLLDGKQRERPPLPSCR